MFSPPFATVVPPLFVAALVISIGMMLVLAVRWRRLRLREIAQLDAALNQALATIGEVRRVSGEASRQTAALQEQLSQTIRHYEQTLRQLGDELLRAKADNTDLTEQREMLWAEVHHRTTEWDAVRTELDRATSEASRREAEIAELAELLEQNSEVVHDLNQVTGREEGELERLKDELVRTEATLDQLRDEVRQRVQAQHHLERKLRSFRQSFRVVSARH